MVLEHDADVGDRLDELLASTTISPSVGSVSPAAISISVLLPQPDGPISDTNSPPLIENDTSSIAVNTSPLRLPGKRLVMRRPSIAAPLAAVCAGAAIVDRRAQGHGGAFAGRKSVV